MSQFVCEELQMSSSKRSQNLRWAIILLGWLTRLAREMEAPEVEIDLARARLGLTQLLNRPARRPS
jgi:hypothetical protein